MNFQQRLWNFHNWSIYVQFCQKWLSIVDRGLDLGVREQMALKVLLLFLLNFFDNRYFCRIL